MDVLEAGSNPPLFYADSKFSISTSTARYSAYSLITLEDQLTRFERVFLKVFQPGGKNYPAVLSGPPQLLPGQLWKLFSKALEVFSGSVNPNAIRGGLLDTVAK